ncbi:MAG: FIST N-terminal domain-containing protein [Candidatus Paceibacterota bacterium]
MIHVQQRSWTEKEGWSTPDTDLPEEPQLVFVFGDRNFVAKAELFQQIRQFYPKAYICTSSTAGNILGSTVSEESVTISAVYFEKTNVSFVQTTIINQFDSQNVGKKLAEFLPTEGLVHSFVLSDGLSVNGSEVVASINKHLPTTVTVTGGLAGDGSRFAQTVVGCNVVPQSNQVVLVGLYGSSLRVGYASRGGWTATEDAYIVTRSENNVLYELNNEPALDVYKKLLGDATAQLPSSALLFPLQLTLKDEGTVVRTILGVDEKSKSMTFAGNIPQGVTAHLMHASIEELIASAHKAGEEASVPTAPVQFALLVSCVGRRLVLKEKAVEEVRAVHDALGPQAVVHGFYSYGELCPSKESGVRCLLHNQTMTVTTFSEM